MHIRPMAMGFLVCAYGHFRQMGMQDAVSQNELDMRGVRAPRRPCFQFQIQRVGHEIGLPHVFSRPHGNEGALALEVAGIAFPVRKCGCVLEDELLAAEQIIDRRHVTADGEARWMLAGGVKELMPQIEWGRENRARSPFEVMARAVMSLDARAALAADDDDRIFVEVAHGGCFAAGWDLDDENRHKIPAPFDMGDTTGDPEAVPMAQVQAAQIKPEVFVDRNSLTPRPF